ncbi:hypothetical protein QUA13_21020 [Microcoleus sp. S28C3]|uniref:hypothetical protein n=1 Tax=Microcoleus sp. S28C3 TaxID=3055414 RepID=UPI002FD3DE7B
MFAEEGRRKKEEGRRKKEEGRRKKEEGRKSRVLAIKYILTVGAATIILKGYCGLMDCSIIVLS